MAQSSGIKTAAATTATDAGRSYVDWSAIIAGAVFATAVAFLLMTFGSAIGLSLTPLLDGEGARIAAVIAVGLWVLWVAVSSFMAGAYITGRMRRTAIDATPHEVDIRDGIHGLVMWGVGTLLGAAVAAFGITGAAGVGAQAVSGAAAAVVEVTDEAAADPYQLDRLFRSEDAGRSASAAAREQADRILAESADSGEMADDDQSYLADLVARNTGLAPDDARERVTQLAESIRTTAEEAAAAAELARQVGIIAAFIVASALLVGGAGAWWAAGVGGRHRDEQTEFLRFAPRRPNS